MAAHHKARQPQDNIFPSKAIANNINMSYGVFESYDYNPGYTYNHHNLAHEEFFPDQPRSNPGRHHASFSQYDGSVDYHYDSQYAANTTRRLTVNYHPTTVSASAIEDNRGSYSPVSSPTSRHSDNLPSSPTSRYLPTPHQNPAYRSIYLTPKQTHKASLPRQHRRLPRLLSPSRLHGPSHRHPDQILF